jgi:hypothetical protein
MTSRDARKLRWQSILNEWECPHGVEVVMMCATCLPDMVLTFADTELIPEQLVQLGGNAQELAGMIRRINHSSEIKSKISAPFTEAQAAALNQYQRAGRMHPFTCPREHELSRVRHTGQMYKAETRLVAMVHQGWECPDPACDYTQNWAHTFMVDPWFTWTS